MGTAMPRASWPAVCDLVFRFTRRRSRNGQERLEAGFTEMAVGGQRVGEAEVAHDVEAGAVGERVAVVGVPAKKRLRGLESLRADPDEIKAAAQLRNFQQA